MDIRLLGPVDVVVDGRVRSLPGGGERELLALLALSAGRVVAVPALVDGLWSEALPVARSARRVCTPGTALMAALMTRTSWRAVIAGTCTVIMASP